MNTSNTGTGNDWTPGGFSQLTNVQFVKKTCRECGETYAVLEALSDIDDGRCADCTKPDPLGAVPDPFEDANAPLMEYGPLSRRHWS